MFVGPSLVSPDMRNNAMPLYLSRPISKLNYILGKFLVLLVLGSAISWVPSVLLMVYQGYLAGNGWMAANAHLPFAAIGISLAWITTLAMLSLAISATVKLAAIARLAFFGFLFVFGTLGNIISVVIGGWIGSMFHLFDVIRALEQSWFGLGSGLMPASAAAASLGAVTIVSFFVLMRRIRANEVA
jgi:ABC-2 type transport system permease protein